MKSLSRKELWHLLVLIVSFHFTTAMREPRIQVISHNLAGTFCKIRHGENSNAYPLQLNKIIELMQSYKDLVEEQSTDIVIFHFQEVCEAKFEKSKIYEFLFGHVGFDQILSHNSMEFALRKVFRGWSCVQMVFMVNFGTFVCYKNNEIVLDFSLALPIINLTNDWGKSFLPEIVTNVDEVISSLEKTPISPKEKNTKDFSTTNPNGSGYSFEDRQRLFLTKGSIIVPIVLEMSRVGYAASESIKLWILSANVHFSSKTFSDRVRHLGILYNNLVRVESCLRRKATEDQVSKHIFFSFISGDFNSRSISAHGSEVELLNYQNDDVAKSSENQDPENLFAKQVALCLLFHKKFGQSNYDKKKIEKFFSDDKSSAQSHYYKMCTPIFKKYLKEREEFRASYLEKIRKLINTKDEFPMLVEAEVADQPLGELDPLTAHLEKELLIKNELLNKEKIKVNQVDSMPDSKDILSRKKPSKLSHMTLPPLKSLANKPPSGLLNFPTFAFDVYTKLNNQNIDFLQETYNDFKSLSNESEGQSSKITMENFGKAFYEYTPKNLPEKRTFKKDLKKYLEEVSKAQLKAGPTDIFNKKTVPTYDELKKSLSLNEEELKAASRKIMAEESKPGPTSYFSDSSQIEPWKFLDIEYELTPTDHETPSWCDRLMYLSNPQAKSGITVYKYRAHFDVRFSDHVPITFVADLTNIEEKDNLASNFDNNDLQSTAASLNLENSTSQSSSKKPSSIIEGSNEELNGSVSSSVFISSPTPSKNTLFDSLKAYPSLKITLTQKDITDFLSKRPSEKDLIII